MKKGIYAVLAGYFYFRKHLCQSKKTFINQACNLNRSDKYQTYWLIRPLAFLPVIFLLLQLCCHYSRVSD